jgi:hypothetical protein
MRAMEAAQEYVQGLVQNPLPKYDHKVLTGLWWKDRELTDFESYSQQLDLIGLGGIQKKGAMFFIRGIRLEADGEGMSLQTLLLLICTFPVSTFGNVYHPILDTSLSLIG